MATFTLSVACSGRRVGVVHVDFRDVDAVVAGGVGVSHLNCLHHYWTQYLLRRVD